MIYPKNDNANFQIGKILFETDNYYKALTYFKNILITIQDAQKLLLILSLYYIKLVNII